jgi:SHS2 domain-containing protein
VSEAGHSYVDPPRQSLHSAAPRRRARGRSTRTEDNGCEIDWRERFALIGAEAGDASFVASGSSVGSLFRSASEELLAATVERADLIRDQVASQVMLVEEEFDFLLPRFLNGLVYLRETGRLLLRARDVRLDLSDKIHLHCDLAGEIFDPRRHKLIREVTRVTTRPLRFRREGGNWEAMVTLHL